MKIRPAVMIAVMVLLAGNLAFAQPNPAAPAQPSSPPAGGAAVAPGTQPAAQPGTQPQQPAKPTGAPASPSGGSFLTGLLPIILIFVVFYFLLIMPQQRQRKKHTEMLAALKSGDRVIVLGGVHGIITRLRDNTMFVKIAENTEVEVDRSAVSHRIGGDQK